METITLQFVRTRKEVAEVSLEVTDEVASLLRSDPKQLDTWAMWTVAPMARDWKPMRQTTADANPDTKWTAEWSP